MELAKMVIDYVLECGFEEETYTTLVNARKLLTSLPDYMADDVIKALFAEEGSGC